MRNARLTNDFGAQSATGTSSRVAFRPLRASLKRRPMRRNLAGLVFLLFLAPLARGYSVLTHEAIIDTAWNDNIKPLLLRRFPAASADELRQAQAYAYGGAIIQD